LLEKLILIESILAIHFIWLIVDDLDLLHQIVLVDKVLNLMQFLKVGIFLCILTISLLAII